jgi:rare lipoprotein A
MTRFLARARCTSLALAVVLASLSGCATTGGRNAIRPASSDVGIASFYGRPHHGRPTASGERFDQEELTAAHPTLAFGTRVRVTNLENDRAVVVRINDRGPFRRGRIIDVSRRAARELGFVAAGTARVRVDVLDR